MIVQQIVEKAMQSAQAAQAVLITQETSAVNFENDRLKSAATSQRTDITVKVVVDGKIGISTTTDPYDAEGVVRRALEAAEFGTPVHFEMPSPRELVHVKTFDPELLSLAKPEMVHMGREMMDMIKAYNSEILTDAILNGPSQDQIPNSAGTLYSDDTPTTLSYPAAAGARHRYPLRRLWIGSEEPPPGHRTLPARHPLLSDGRKYRTHPLGSSPGDLYTQRIFTADAHPGAGNRRQKRLAGCFTSARPPGPADRRFTTDHQGRSFHRLRSSLRSLRRRRYASPGYNHYPEWRLAKLHLRPIPPVVSARSQPGTAPTAL
jgi:hypothetical protein